MTLVSRIGLLCLVATAAFGAPTLDEVGDPDSFGRPVKHLGMKSTPLLMRMRDCSTVPSASIGVRCSTVPAQTAQGPVNDITITETNLATVKLPANAAQSLLCFAIQPNGSIAFNNPMATTQHALLNVQATYTIKSSVLNNLVHPTTGQPLNGRIEGTLPIASQSKTLPSKGFESASITTPRNCVGGLVWKRMLIDQYGLTNAQATAFFANPLTLTFGMKVRARTFDTLALNYAVRLYGD